MSAMSKPLNFGDQAQYSPSLLQILQMLFAEGTSTISGCMRWHAGPASRPSIQNSSQAPATLCMHESCPSSMSEVFRQKFQEARGTNII